MAKKGLLDIVPEARRKTLAHLEDGVWRVESRQDTTHIMEAAKILADEPPRDKSFRHVGFIPDADMNRMFVEGSFHDPKTIERFLKDHPRYATGRW